MKKLCSLTLTAVMVLGAVASAFAATEVKMTGDARIYGLFMSNRNYTGYDRTGTQKEEKFEIWERFRLRSDFVANEAVKFRLGLKVEDTWGHNTFTAANPSRSSVQVYLAYLQFKWPDTDVEITAGLQPVSLPHSALFGKSPVFSDQMAAAIITAPIIPDTLSVMTGFGRLIDLDSEYNAYGNSTFTSAGGDNSDEVDAYFLALPITVDGFKATPWGVISVVGRDAAYATAANKNYKNVTDASAGTFADSLLSTGALQSTRRAWGNNQNAYYWVGSAFEVTALDPIRFYADVIYGAGAMSDRSYNRRHGWFIDFGAEYTGLEYVTPQVFAWWSSGEDSSTGNGSERMPYLRSSWGPGGSFLFDDGQDLNHGVSNMYVSPVGNYGIGMSLKNISFIEKLSHRLTFLYVHGTNSPMAMRYGAALGSVNGYNYVSKGRDLTWNEYLFAVNFDTKYMIYENLAAVVETGWSTGHFQKHVWSNCDGRSTNDAWKVAFGLTYKF